MEPEMLVWGIKPLNLILGGIFGLLGMGLLAQEYLERKYAHLMDPTHNTPQQPAATEVATETAEIITFPEQEKEAA